MVIFYVLQCSAEFKICVHWRNSLLKYMHKWAHIITGQLDEFSDEFCPVFQNLPVWGTSVHESERFVTYCNVWFNIFPFRIFIATKGIRDLKYCSPPRPQLCVGFLLLINAVLCVWVGSEWQLMANFCITFSPSSSWILLNGTHWDPRRKAFFR